MPKIILISAGLFITLALVSSGWYMTSSKLDGYIANDTKYRQLRLDTSIRSLQHYLDRIDSMYDARPDMRKIVLETEEKNRKNFERLEKAERLKEEAKRFGKRRRRKNERVQNISANVGNCVCIYTQICNELLSERFLVAHCEFQNHCYTVTEFP